MKDRIHLGLSILVAGVFLFAGLTKLFDPVEFSRSIGRYQLVDHPFSLILALWIPWLEVLAGSALFFRRWRLAGSYLLLGLLCVFEVILVSAYLRGLNIDCGCFGSGIEQSIIFAFIRNLGLMLLLCIIIRHNRRLDEAP